MGQTAAAAERGLHDGLEAFAQDVLALAKRDVPIGDPRLDPNPAVSLSESGHLEWISRRVVDVVFDTAYATKIHEATHFEHPRGGTHHYLENALKALMPRFEEYIADAVEAELGFVSGSKAGPYRFSRELPG